MTVEVLYTDGSTEKVQVQDARKLSGMTVGLADAIEAAKKMLGADKLKRVKMFNLVEDAF